jgi:hypothetical protein
MHTTSYQNIWQNSQGTIIYCKNLLTRITYVAISLIVYKFKLYGTLVASKKQKPKQIKKNTKNKQNKTQSIVVFIRKCRYDSR